MWTIDDLIDDLLIATSGPELLLRRRTRDLTRPTSYFTAEIRPRRPKIVIGIEHDFGSEPDLRFESDDIDLREATLVYRRRLMTLLMPFPAQRCCFVDGPGTWHEWATMRCRLMTLLMPLPAQSCCFVGGPGT